MFTLSPGTTKQSPSPQHHSPAALRWPSREIQLSWLQPDDAVNKPNSDTTSSTNNGRTRRRNMVASLLSRPLRNQRRKVTSNTSRRWATRPATVAPGAGGDSSPNQYSRAGAAQQSLIAVQYYRATAQLSFHRSRESQERNNPATTPARRAACRCSP